MRAAGCAPHRHACPSATDESLVHICDTEPFSLECTGPHATTPTAVPGATDILQTFDDPEGRFEFDLPGDWHLHPMADPGMGVTIVDAPFREDATRWIELWVATNPERASIAAWIAENGLPWPGEVTAQDEGWVHGVPVLRQRVEGDNPQAGGHYIYALLWYPAGDVLLLWTGWPGDEPGVLNLMERMAWGVRGHD